MIVMHGWQSEPTDGPKGEWGSASLSLSVFEALSVTFSLCLSISLSVYSVVAIAVAATVAQYNVVQCSAGQCTVSYSIVYGTPDPLQTSHAGHRFANSEAPSFRPLLARCRSPCPCHRKCQLNTEEWSEHVVPLSFFTTCALRQHGLHLSKFLNFQKWSQTLSFKHF